MKRHLTIAIVSIFMIIVVCGTASAAEGDTVQVTPTDSNGNTYYNTISGDGNWVVYSSDADNIVPGDINGYADIFLYNRQSGTTTRVTPANSNSASTDPNISDDGIWITYESEANNIVSGDSNGFPDIFLYNRQSGTTVMVTPTGSDGGSTSPCISGDGNWIAYRSEARNIVPGDTDGFNSDIFLYNRQSGTTIMVTPTGSIGHCGNPIISDDGNWITYSSYAAIFGDTEGYEDVFLYNRLSGTTILLTPANSNGHSQSSSISDDGNWITYISFDSNIVPGDINGYADIFLYNRQSGTTTRVTPANSNGNSLSSSISGDGTWITYESEANNIVAGDINGYADIFLYNRLSGTITRITSPTSNGDNRYSSISDDGNWITYFSEANNIVADSTQDEWADIFLYDNPLVVPGASSDPGAQINEVNAASNTVGMQNTGIPIAGLILAIMAVFAGLVVPKRK